MFFPLILSRYNRNLTVIPNNYANLWAQISVDQHFNCNHSFYMQNKDYLTHGLTIQNCVNA